MLIRILFISILTLGACAARSQTYNEYHLYLGKERKVGTKIVFDTILTGYKLIDTISKNHVRALATGKNYGKEFGMVARVKYIRRLTKTEEKKVKIYH
jgi:hypothetical protein